MSDQTIVAPDLEETLIGLKENIFATFNCIQIGRLESFNKADQTAVVAIQFKRRLRGDEVADYPLLLDCPVFVLQGGGAYIDLPVAAGDYCLVLFNDRNIDTWWDTANVVQPQSLRKHALSDGIVLVGINPRTSVRDIDGGIVRVLGPSGPGNEEPAARQKDAIQSTSSDDAAYWNWVAIVSSTLNALAPGSVPTVPTSLTGQITGGSSEVFIG